MLPHPLTQYPPLVLHPYKVTSIRAEPWVCLLVPQARASKPMARLALASKKPCSARLALENYSKCSLVLGSSPLGSCACEHAPLTQSCHLAQHHPLTWRAPCIASSLRTASSLHVMSSPHAATSPHI